MKYALMGLGLAGALSMMIYVSGGTQSFMANMLSTQGVYEETIDLNTTTSVNEGTLKKTSQTTRVTTKKTSQTTRVTTKKTPIRSTCKRLAPPPFNTPSTPPDLTPTASEDSPLTNSVGASTGYIPPDAPISISGVRSILINEVAWMGSRGDAKREWVELKNISSTTVRLAGWELLDKSGRTDVRFGASQTLAPNAFIVLRRGIEFTGTINNSDEALYLFDVTCAVVDEVFANPAWPAGDYKNEKTAERGADFSWHTSAVSGGTPGKENSTSSLSFSALLNPSSRPNLSASLLNSATSNNTTSKNTIGASSGYIPPDAPIVTSVPTTQSSGMGAIRISEVMTGRKGDADYDFVELYNNSNTAVVLTGWSIKRRSSTGKESTLVAEARLENKHIAPHGYLLLANEKGYTGVPIADVVWPASYSFSGGKNAVIVLDDGGAVTDETAWENIPDGQSLVRDSWDSGTYHIFATPTPGIANIQ